MTRISSLLAIVIGATLSSAPQAAEWSEMGDAGPFLESAQEPIGTGALTTIFGTITVDPTDVPLADLSKFNASVADVDLYQIFISDPVGFSAETTNGDSNNSDAEFDAQLALFDENGFGLYLNDDREVNNGNARLPPDHQFGPMTEGTYYLAIFDDNVTPFSALNPNGQIFPDPPSPFTAVVGPNGPGGGGALIEWFPELPINADRSYSILLTGVTLVPEPSSFALAVSALVSLMLLRAPRRR
jgi:hypothetical protein